VGVGGTKRDEKFCWVSSGEIIEVTEEAGGMSEYTKLVRARGPRMERAALS